MLSIKDWHKFQHYKTGRGAPPWIKLYRDLLNDPAWFALDPEAAKFLVACWLIAAENDGNLPDSKTLAFRYRVASKKIDELLTLCKDWIISDDSTLLASCYQVAIPETETETEEKREEKKTLRGSRLPLDWQPRAEDPQDTQELERFRDYWIAKAGKDGVKLDWNATWRNWMRNKRDWNPTQTTAKPDTYRIGHPRGLVKPEPEAPKLTDEQKAERARQVDALLKGFRRPVDGLGEPRG